MADNKNYDRLPEESLSELRRKYLRKKPLYGRAPGKKAFLSGSTATRLSYSRSADVLMLLSVFILGLIFLISPVMNSEMRNLSPIQFIFDKDMGIIRAIDRLAYDSSFQEFLSSLRIFGTCVTMIVALIEMVLHVFRAFKAFSKKASSDLKMCTVGTWMTLFSTFIWLSLFGRGNEILGYSMHDVYMSDTLSGAIVVAFALCVIASFISYAKGFSTFPSKKPCWWSSALLTTVYSFIAFTMIKVNISGVVASAAAGFGMIPSGYSTTNSGFERFLIGVFNCFIIYTFFALKKHVTNTLYSEMGCTLGFAKGYVKTAPYPSSRIKAAICPAISIFAASVLASAETGILWPAGVSHVFFIKVTLALIVSAIICKATFNKTRSSIR